MYLKLCSSVIAFIFLVNADRAMANDNLTLGAKLGMTVSNQTNTDIDSKIGFEIGGAHRHGLSELLALNTELSYVQKGSKFGDRLVIDLSQALSNVRVSRNYIQLAVHISADIIKSNQFFIPEPYLGFSTGYLLSANLSGDSIGADKVSRDVRDDFKKLEFGILFGMGFRVFQKLTMDLRYSLGLSSIVEEFETKNKMLSFSMGYFFVK